jgi:phage pi2 protein 07
MDFLGSQIVVAPPEYVIIRKLEFYQEGNSARHLSDIESILSFSSDFSISNFLRPRLKSVISKHLGNLLLYPKDRSFEG